MVKNLANRAMTTEGQKACHVIDHMVQALGNDPSSSLRRALILVDIDKHPGTTQTGILERLSIHKSAVSREIDWLFNYGCIMIREDQSDARSKKIEICGYAKRNLDSALDYFAGDHDKLIGFIELYTRVLRQEKPTLRDAKILASLYTRRKASKQDVIEMLYGGPASTDNRAFNKLIEDGILKGN